MKVLEMTLPGDLKKDDRICIKIMDVMYGLIPSEKREPLLVLVPRMLAVYSNIESGILSTETIHGILTLRPKI